jgi:hypothetical protein
MFNKFISLCLIGIQLTLVTGVSGAQAADRSLSAELSLLETVLTLRGLGLQEQELNRQIGATLERYNRTAPAEGREERLQAALVEMQVLTPQQARGFGAEARAAQARLAGVDASVDRQTAALRAQVELLSRISLNGAQFSSCGLGAGLIIGGVVSAFVGLALREHNPTCHSDLTRGYECYIEDSCTSADDYNCGAGYWSTCYPEVCDVPDYYPNRPAGNITLIAGGVAAAAGILILVLGDGC